MISDERLREAAREAEEKLLASLPKPEDCEATFSPEYKRKMKKLARRTDHPVIYWVQKAVACILLTILIGGGGILTFSTEARAAFVGWVREVYETWFVYNYEGVDREFPEDNVFYPAWIPDGYYELKRSISDDKVSIIYENEEGYLLSFTYTSNVENTVGCIFPSSDTTVSLPEFCNRRYCIIFVIGRNIDFTICRIVLKRQAYYRVNIAGQCLCWDC